MSYIVEFNATFTKNVPGKVFVDWLDTVSYADIAEFFPEIAEANFPDIKADITAFSNGSKIIVGQTPGVSNLSETITSTGINRVITFNTTLDYNTYNSYCIDSKQYGIKPGFAFELPETTIENFVTMNGLSLSYFGGSKVNNLPNICEWLTAKYYTEYGITQSCVHSQT